MELTEIHKKNNEQDRRLKALEQGQQEILELLRPISDTYKTAGTLMKWTQAILVVVSIIIGILVGISKLK
jgi:hypothetical protein